MKSEEITTLAREYAKWVTQQENGDKAYIPAEQAIASTLLHWLSGRYCLVKKIRLIEEYKSATANFNNASDPVIPTMDYYLGIMKFIESLFPEIAKEVEE